MKFFIHYDQIDDFRQGPKYLIVGAFGWRLMIRIKLQRAFGKE